MKLFSKLDEEKQMRRALCLARRAASHGEVPVAALVLQLRQGKPPRTVGRAHNLTEAKQDPCAHAELLAIQQAARRLGRWRLNDCLLLVTLEPCAMCAGAMVWARLRRVVYGTRDPKAGACGSVLKVLSHPRLNHRPEVQGDVLAGESAELLRDFFRKRR